MLGGEERSQRLEDKSQEDECRKAKGPGDKGLHRGRCEEAETGGRVSGRQEQEARVRSPSSGRRIRRPWSGGQEGEPESGGQVKEPMVRRPWLGGQGQEAMVGWPGSSDYGLVSTDWMKRK